MYKGIIFDKDGTLISIDRLWSTVYRNALKQLSDTMELTLNLDKALKNIGIIDDSIEAGSMAAIGTVREVMEKALWENQGFISEEKSTKHLGYFETLVYKEVVQNKSLIEWIHGEIPEMLKNFKEKGISLAVITADSQKNTYLMLEYLGIFLDFDYIGCGDDPVFLAKPEIAQGIHYMKKMGLYSEDVLMVGDSYYDEDFAKGLNVGFHRIDSGRDMEVLMEMIG